MEYETMIAEEGAQNEIVLCEESFEELMEQTCSVPWDIEDQLFEEWRAKPFSDTKQARVLPHLPKIKRKMEAKKK